MGIDRKAFIDSYVDELLENISVINNAILVLKNDKSNAEEMNLLLRALHTIKGSSRMLKFSAVEKVTHGLENVYKGISEKRYELDGSIIQLSFFTMDLLKSAAEKISSSGEDRIEIQKVLGIYDKVYANESYSLEDILITGKVKKDAVPEESPKSKKIHFADSIRVKSNTIDRIIQYVNEIILKQFQLRGSYEQYSLMQEKYFLSGAKDTKKTGEVNNIKAGFHNLHLAENRLGESFDILQQKMSLVKQSLLEMRMLPLKTILAPLHIMAEETALSLGKEIDVFISGEELLADKMILEKINDPLIHIVRNSLDHGLETREERVAAGKKKKGKLKIICSIFSNTLKIEIFDNGRGIDYNKIRKKLIEKNPLQKEDILKYSRAELNAVLFQSGFSTKKTVNELSGRGVGLDIVKNNIEAIRGNLEIKSKKYRGTLFTLTLPLSLSNIDGFFVKVAGKKLFIPSAYVKETMLLAEKDKKNILNKESFQYKDSMLPIFSLRALLGFREEKEKKSQEFILILSYLNKTNALKVDELSEYSELIYNELPKHLSPLKEIQGLVINEDFHFVPILNIPKLLEKAKDIKNVNLLERYVKDKKEYKNILIADDSKNTLQILTSILASEHYNVLSAGDGIEALEKLHSNRIHLLISDLRMPRMDGRTLIENIKRDENFKELAILVLTTDSSQSVREELYSLGVNEVLEKSDFDRTKLLALVSRYTQKGESGV